MLVDSSRPKTYAAASSEGEQSLRRATRERFVLAEKAATNGSGEGEEEEEEETEAGGKQTTSNNMLLP